MPSQLQLCARVLVASYGHACYAGLKTEPQFTQIVGWWLRWELPHAQAEIGAANGKQNSRYQTER